MVEVMDAMTSPPVTPRTAPPTSPAAADASQRGPLLAWQLRLYPLGHGDRRNLLLHLLTAPLFWLGAAALVLAPWVSPGAAAAGLSAMVAAVAIQGRGHRREAVAPVPFRGPADAAVRIVAEQLVTFPRFVLGGGLARALRR